MKRLLNKHEEATNDRLQAATEQWGAHTFVKVRLADVLPIDGSGISDASYRFALQSHFDFLVTDADLQPLFAVEFDGPSHQEPAQARRDSLKSGLCDRFALPLLRINARYLEPRENGLDLLAWCVHAWFCTKVVAEAYLAGDMKAVEVSPLDLLFLSGSDQPLPLFLSARARAEIQELADKHSGLDWAPSCFVGEGPEGEICALAWLRVRTDTAIWVRTGMRGQSFRVELRGKSFPVDLDEGIEHLAVMDLRRKLDLVFTGIEKPRPIPELRNAIAEFKERYRGGGYSGLELP